MPSFWTDVEYGISAATGEQFTRAERKPVGGGCINAAYHLRDRERSYFVKTSAPQNLSMFDAEAAGLAELERAAAICVPKEVCTGGNKQASWLVLEFIEFGGSGSGRAMGSALAALHRVTARNFGWHRANTIGATPQINTPSPSWVEFWRERRLRFQLELAARNGAPKTLLAQGDRLLQDFPALLGAAAVVPALLHGDLWGGNAGFDRSGAPIIFDPAVYYGHREADLAMTELFGGFDADFYAAYREAYPLDAGYPVRRDLYNLYHVLNHYNLFRGGYAAQAEAMIKRLLAEV
jgi:protein-ribulosamine 3-kinase